jgi:hypothetical protein
LKDAGTLYPDHEFLQKIKDNINVIFDRVNDPNYDEIYEPLPVSPATTTATHVHDELL